MEQLKLRKLRCRFLIRSVTRIQLRLITLLGNCGCVAVASFLGVPSPLDLVESFRRTVNGRGLNPPYLRDAACGVDTPTRSSGVVGQ
jgi:hypothetical protein